MKRTLFRLLSLPLVLLSLGAAVSACNTMEGVGEDTQAAGRSLERSAEDAKN